MDCVDCALWSDLPVLYARLAIQGAAAREDLLWPRNIFVLCVCLGMREDVYRVCGCESLVVVN